ncbi:PIWI domain protein [Ichthyophthirius multifiliis]|uniref:PIWI domain protein n=1 Tax=Ichthyophthirius multifiliis TaxID=5932 RepID=G0QN82_ICHMU|nr:PIWI domain protein [Ichthyophthirius multifiliis]EGR33319.1 PIWI domain protein [Ichthyophthirius multifiliis]|eukprot:XP_004037305.1 PIWI domain protein [Ichthyophthirius multifiliis]
MAAKCGATLWISNPPKGVPDKTMIIGTHVQKIIINGQEQYVAGFVASQDEYMI